MSSEIDSATLSWFRSNATLFFLGYLCKPKMVLSNRAALYYEDSGIKLLPHFIFEESRAHLNTDNLKPFQCDALFRRRSVHSWIFILPQFARELVDWKKTSAKRCNCLKFVFLFLYSHSCYCVYGLEYSPFHSHKGNASFADADWHTLVEASLPNARKSCGFPYTTL